MSNAPIVRFKLAGRLARDRFDVAARLPRLVEEGKNISSILPPRRGAYKVANDDLFSAPPKLNDPFSRICKKTPSSKAQSLVYLDNLVKIETALLSPTRDSVFLLLAYLDLICSFGLSRARSRREGSF